MRFLDEEEGMMKQSESIFKVSVREAMGQVVWDTKSFVYAALYVVRSTLHL
jgi:hypothetical protein